MDIVKHFEKNLDKLTGANWVQLIQAKEEYAAKCDWSKLCGSDWAKLLKTHPQYKNKINFDEFYGWDWGNFLVEFPEYAHLCPPDKRQAWCDFIEAHPNHPALNDFDFSTLEEWDWDSLLKKHPFLVERYPGWDDVSESNLSPSGWELRVAAFPERFAVKEYWEYWNHYLPHAGLDGKMVLPYSQDADGEIQEISFLGGLLPGYRRVKQAAYPILLRRLCIPCQLVYCRTVLIKILYQSVERTVLHRDAV